jgi:hypothetical protein
MLYFAYAGIGSQKTPPDVLELMANLGREMAHRRMVLRSGGAQGADMAFEHGCTQAGGGKEIYLPWPRFNGSTSSIEHPRPEAFDLAANYVPYWGQLKRSVKQLHARNMHQILGWELDSPAQFVLCWTPGGKLVGGTAVALRVALDRDIPIYNFGVPRTPKQLQELEDQFEELFFNLI